MVSNSESFLILGMARSGQAAAKWLKEKGSTVFSFDDNALRNQANNCIKTLDEIPWNSLTAVIQSPGIPFSFPAPHPVTEKAQSKGIPVLSDINLLRTKEKDATYIGITGTNGKSTTTALIGHILEKNNLKNAVGGNIGIPALSLPSLGQDGVYVLELSSFQLELSAPLDLDISVWVNISEDHLDRHGTMESYVASKENVFKGCKKAVISVDDPFSEKVYQKIKDEQPTLSVSVKRKADVWVEKGILFQGSKKIADLNPIVTLRGGHNHQNAAIAFAATRHYGLSSEEIVSALESFPGLAHRLEIVGQEGSVLFVNDSKATNADAAAKALDSYRNYAIYWIAGGRPKSQGIRPLKPYFSSIEHAFLIGEAQEDFSQTLGIDVPHSLCDTLEKALKEATQMAMTDNKESAVILLSPACASLDQFRDYEERGDTFRNLVGKMS